jgi:putative pyruvate formate lyase activating enzyme
MWQLVRPDAVNALKDSLVKKILPRYAKVVEDELPAKFQTAKRISFNPKKNLWQEHKKAMKNFYKTEREIDKEKVKIEDLKIAENSLIDLKILLTKEVMKSCELCERKCHVDRLKGGKGECKVDKCLISSENMHLGEEFHISPSHTIFFMGCNFHCQYCQNWSISQWFEEGFEYSPEELTETIELRRREGSRNVNLVGGEPTPNLLAILEILKLCKVNVPVIWNSNMYMSEQTMKILDGVVDMYLSDFKYGNDDCASRLSKVNNYFEVCSRNHLIATKQAEITLRHLILPNHVECCSNSILKWIAQNIRNKCLINIMDQYRHEFKANKYPKINRKITQEEFNSTVNFAKKLKLNFIT